MKLLDLYCGAGGAAMGYHQAGFTDIVGVDINPQPNYPYNFHQANALDTDPEYLKQFDLIHASPPCQAHSTLRHSPGAKPKYPMLIHRTRQLIKHHPYVIENVPGAPIRPDLILCGSQFNLTTDDGHALRRHRIFETNFPTWNPTCNHQLPVLGVYGDLAKNQRPSTRGVKAGRQQAHQLMGINWMTDQELTEAIPPAYTKYIGEAFINQHTRTA